MEHEIEGRTDECARARRSRPFGAPDRQPPRSSTAMPISVWRLLHSVGAVCDHVIARPRRLRLPTGRTHTHLFLFVLYGIYMADRQYVTLPRHNLPDGTDTDTDAAQRRGSPGRRICGAPDQIAAGAS